MNVVNIKFLNFDLSFEENGGGEGQIEREVRVEQAKSRGRLR